MNKINNPRAKNIVQLFLGIFAILIITISCEEDPSSLGANLLPDSDIIECRYDTTLTFNSYVTTKNAVSTSKLSTYFLGIIDDPYFGSFKGEFAGQFIPSVKDTNLASYILDSTVLYIAIDSVYGQAIGSISFDVYELNTELNNDSSYYSTDDISTLYSVADKINTTCQIRGDSLIALTLSNTFGARLLDTTFYRSDSVFKGEFMGISIIPTILNSTGAIFNTNFLSKASKIALFCHNGTSDSISINYMFAYSSRFANYSYDYSSAVINDYLTNPENENDDLIFLQGVNGVSSKLTFSNIEPWFEGDSSYSILKADITIPVLTGDNLELFSPPQNLYFSYANTDSNLIYVSDISSGIFDGSYNEADSSYTFNISKHFMNILNRNIEDSCLNLDIVNKSSYYNRVILKSGDNIKMRVTYTKHK